VTLITLDHGAPYKLSKQILLRTRTKFVLFCVGCFRATKIEQRVKHEALYGGKQLVIHPGYLYFLVPSIWLSKWRSYLGARGKNVLAVDEPVGLEGFILSLLCQKVSHPPSAC
jgi:hypothetical protein